MTVTNERILGIFTWHPQPDGSAVLRRRHEGQIEEQLLKPGESAWGMKWYGVNPVDDDDESDNERPQSGFAVFTGEEP